MSSTLSRPDKSIGPGANPPLKRQDSVTSSTTNESKWGTLRRAVKRQALELVGLEQPESLKEHQDAVQRSIVVGKISRDIGKRPDQPPPPVQQSLVKAILPHETVSPLVTQSLLQHLADTSSRRPSANPTPLSSMATTSQQQQQQPHPLHMDEIELKEMSDKLREEQSITASASLSTFLKHRSMSATAPQLVPQSRSLEHSISVPVDTSIVLGTGDDTADTPPPLYLSKPTGRLHSRDIVEQETKPDLWKIAYYGIKFLTKTKESSEDTDQYDVKKSLLDDTQQQSFNIEEATDDDEIGVVVLDEQTDPTTEPLSRPSIASQASIASMVSNRYQPLEIEDNNFFGHELPSSNWGLGGGTLRRNTPFVPRTVKGDPMGGIVEEETEHQDKGEEEGTGITFTAHSHSYGTQETYIPPSTSGHIHEAPPTYDEAQYRPPFKILGGRTLKLLQFRYRHVPPSTHQKLDELEEKGLHRPFFTYWLMTVHTIIMVVTLSLYGFAPYGYVQFTERSLVQQSNLAVEVVERTTVPNVWGGPSQTALVLLGATYGPCMRRDRQLYEGVDQDVFREANSSGCCVRKDQSGCVQVSSAQDCPSTFADFIYTDPSVNTSTSPYTNRAVCGTSPLTCITPNPSRDLRWQSAVITNWPICTEVQSVSGQSPHLSCEITGRPCCVGIQAQCIVTTLEHCQYLRGTFHSDAFLCSQVDCLDNTCGLLPFVSMNQPDQIYRLWTALFLHAGIIHLVFTLIFDFLILRHVEKYLGWFPTFVIYVGSGIGGNLVSIVFVPYSPEVGPAGGIFGIIAFFIIYIMYQAHRLLRPWVEAVKLLIVILILIGCGLFPYIDNYAHIGGFVFGFFLSGIFVPYYKPNEAELEYYKQKHKKSYDSKKDWIQISKYLFLSLGSVMLMVLLALFLVIFYVLQDPSWEGFTYFNCIPFTSTFCLDYQQNIRSRDIIY